MQAVSSDIRNAVRVVPAADGISIWSWELFGPAAQPGALRALIARAFSVPDVTGVELRRANAFGRIRHRKPGEAQRVWSALSRALQSLTDAETDSSLQTEAEGVFLEGQALRVSRVGGALTTFHIQAQTPDRVRLWHPLLRRDRDVAYRLEEELAASYGVERFDRSALSGVFSIRIDARALDATRLARQLERAWPRLLAGPSAPPAPKRLYVASGLFGLAFTGQYLVPAVRPVAVLSTALYSSPNAWAAAKDLKHGQVGLPALYTTGLVFMLASGMPFAATIFATLMQVWPQLGRRQLVRSQRRLFGAHRRRPQWARLAGTGDAEVEVHVSELRGGEQVRVRRAEVVPVDGVVLEGLASVVPPSALGASIVELAAGDEIRAGSALRDGELVIRVQQAGAHTLASQVDALLPRAAALSTPATQEAERIANRNAKPALALAAVSLLVTRTPRVSQAVIRPDYASAPRLSAQLSALEGLAHGLQHGVLFKQASALDALAQADVFVIDDTTQVERARVEVAAVKSTRGSADATILQHAFTARQYADCAQARALAAAASSAGVRAQSTPVARHAGVSRFRDSEGSTIEVATLPYLKRQNVTPPKAFAALAHERGALWVLRNGTLVGAVTFAHQGKLLGEELIETIKAHVPRARLIYVSEAPDADVQALAARLGFDRAYAGLAPDTKAQLLRNTSRTLWIGDGSHPGARASVNASTVSASLAPVSRLQLDAADVLLHEDGAPQLAKALSLARAHAKRLARDYRIVYALNMLGVAGALGSGATSLQTGLTSHAGTWWIYTRYARALNRLAEQVQARRQRLERALHP